MKRGKGNNEYILNRVAVLFIYKSNLLLYLIPTWSTYPRFQAINIKYIICENLHLPYEALAKYGNPWIEHQFLK
jgi:hypothetical protein